MGRGPRGREMIPIIDIRRENQRVEREIREVIDRVLLKGKFVLGAEVEAFESEFSSYCGVEHGIGVGNGTDALEISLRALGVGVEDKVITVANAGMYSTTAILSVGARPVYVDIDSQSMNMSPRFLLKTVTNTNHLKAIVVTHLFGQMADMPEIMRIADGAHLPVVEDCAHAHGACLGGKRAGSWGRVGCFSFYPTKNLGALGDGGVIVTQDHSLARRVRQLRQYGWTQKYHSTIPGGRNSRLDELQAAILRVKLPFLDRWNQRRRIISQTYYRLLSSSNLKLKTRVRENDVVHLFVIRSSSRDRLRKFLSQHKIQTSIHYPIPDHKQKSIRAILPNSFLLPETEECCRKIVTLPCFAAMNDQEVEEVGKAVLSGLA